MAIHLLALYGVLERNVPAVDALWIRQRGVRLKPAQHNLFRWLTPPHFQGSLTVAEIVQHPTPATRTQQVRLYSTQVWSIWSKDHRSTIAGWYNQLVVPDRL